MRRVMSIAALSVVVSACAAYPPRVLSNEYRAQDVAWFTSRGDNTLVGEALVRTRTGEVRTCAGLMVKLVPDSAHATERLGHFFTQGDRGSYSALDLAGVENFENADPQFYDQARTAVCDSNGQFRFEDLPDGSYWIIAPISWRDNPDAWIPKGGVVGLRTKLQGGETETVVMTPEDIDGW